MKGVRGGAGIDRPSEISEGVPLELQKVILHLAGYYLKNIDIICFLIVISFKSVFIIQVGIILAKRLIVQSCQGPSYPFPTHSSNQLQFVIAAPDMQDTISRRGQL